MDSIKNFFLILDKLIKNICDIYLRHFFHNKKDILMRSTLKFLEI
jgi:hypothetical protein